MEMANQNKEIPEHLSERWETVNRRLGEASLKLVQASEEYYSAIEARVTLSEELKTWQMQTYFNN